MSGEFDFKKNEEWESKCLKKYGYYVHGVDSGDHVNYHTHGVAKTFRHLDLQITLCICGSTAGGIFQELVRRIREEKLILKEGDLIENLIDDYTCRAFQATEMGLPVMRIILPDKNGKFPEDEDCNELFKAQIEYKDE